MKLTEADVLSRARATSLASVKNLNCWGNKISDLSILKEMPNLEVLSMSVNEIASMEFMALCPKLKEVYLRKNYISDLNEIIYLSVLPNLNNLWMTDNPCTEENNYRLRVIKALTRLRKLDNVEITEEERQEASMLSDDLSIEVKLPMYEGVDLTKSLSCDDLKPYITPVMISPDEKPPSADEKQTPTSDALMLPSAIPTDIEPCSNHDRFAADTQEDVQCGTSSSIDESCQSNVLAATLLLINSLDLSELQMLSHAVISKMAELEDGDHEDGGREVIAE